MKNRPLWILLIVALLALLIRLAFFWQPETAGTTPLHATTTTTETPQGGDFRLTSADGPVALSDFRGKVVAVYFGYTFCPDVCPTALINLAQAFTLLTPAELEKAKGLFISVDPERDTPDALAGYVSNFDPRIIGLTGPADEVAQAAAAFRATYRRVDKEGGDYRMDHTAGVFLFHPDGRFASIIDFHEDRRFAVPKLRRTLS